MAEDEQSTAGIRKFTGRARDRLHRRSADSEGADPEPAVNVHQEEAIGEIVIADADLAQLSSAVLREELHAAVDAVMDRHAKEPRDRGALQHELEAAMHEIVDENLDERSLRDRVASEIQTTKRRVSIPVVSTADMSIDVATAKLQGALQTVYGHAKPGATRTMKLAPKLVPVIAGYLSEYIGDEKRLRQMQGPAEKMLAESLHVNPKVAHTIVEVAIGAARTSQRRKAVGNGDTGTEADGDGSH